jgi:hypothetical protein
MERKENGLPECPLTFEVRELHPKQKPRNPVVTVSESAPEHQVRPYSHPLEEWFMKDWYVGG